MHSTHLVGHSHGGVTALQLALDHTTSVRTLSLIEPALVAFIPQAKVIQDTYCARVREEEQDRINRSDVTADWYYYYNYRIVRFYISLTKIILQ